MLDLVGRPGFGDNIGISGRVLAGKINFPDDGGGGNIGRLVVRKVVISGGRMNGSDGDREGDKAEAHYNF